MTEPFADDDAASASSTEDAGAASSRKSRALLDAALARTIAVLAHDLRNSLGVVAMQVEAISVRADAVVPDLPAIRGHANVASDHIESLADMTNALISFARGSTSSDLAMIVAEAAAIVPLRPVSVSTPPLAAVGLDPLVTRAVALEVLILALTTPYAPVFAISSGPSGSLLDVHAGQPLVPDAAVEWVVQFESLGGFITPTVDGIRLQFPPLA